jgi:hypothetical protein
VGNQKFCKVAIGPDSSRCLVNNRFRCVLIVDKKQVDTLDPPLLNRFEKQRLTEENSLDSNMRSMIQKLLNWMDSLQNQSKDYRKEMFPTLDEKQFLCQLVILYRDLYKDDAKMIEIECKKTIIRVATFKGVLRMLDKPTKDKEYWYNEYIVTQKHYTLNQLLNHYLYHWKEEKLFN